MSTHRVVLSQVGHRIASALAGAAIVGGLVWQLANAFTPMVGDSETFHAPIPVTVEPVSIGSPETREEPEARARTDMRAYAIRNDLVIESEDGFTVRPDWHWQWSLYFVDVRANHEVVRIYEAVSTLEPDRRFTAMWYPGAARATDWELVLD